MLFLNFTGFESNDFKSKDVNTKLLGEYKTSIEKFSDAKMITEANKTKLTNLIDKIKTEKDGVTLRSDMSTLVDMLHSLNATSLIGTIVFADEMSKLNLNYYTCYIDQLQLYKTTYSRTNNLYEFSLDEIRSHIKDRSVSTKFEILSGVKNKRLQTIAPSSPPSGGTKKKITLKFKKSRKGKHLLKRSKKN